MSIPPGEIFGFLGANGAGKTTTIRMMCGLTKPTAGICTIDGLNIWKDRFRIRSRFGYVPQKFSLYRTSPSAKTFVSLPALTGFLPEK